MTKRDKAFNNTTSLAKIFNFLGGALIFFGLVYFVGSNWDLLNNFFKILFTVGSALVAFVLGVISSQNKHHPALSGALFMIAGLLLPFGLTVTADVLQLTSPTLGDEIIISALCFTLFFVTNWFLPRDILRLFCVVYASMLFFSSSTYLIENYITSRVYQLPEYLFFILGLIYLALGAYFANHRVSLSGPLYFLGSVFVLTASFQMGGLLLSETISPFWKILSAVLVIESFLLAIPLRSKSMLYVGTLFFVIYLYSITSLFPDFFGKFGWPAIFISLGILFMLLGYFLVAMHRKIIR